MMMFTSAGRLPLIAGIVALAALLVGGLFVPFEARNSVPYGINLTVDFTRHPPISVSGRTVVPNYDGFNRIDLDLRAYQHAASYDLLVHIRPDTPGAADIVTIPLDVKGEQIPDTKQTFANPFVTLRFPPISDSAGKHFYVWIEPGIRNRDNVVALWSIKSYSRVTGHDVIRAFLDHLATKRVDNLLRAAMIVLLAAFVLAFGWLMAATTALAVSHVRAKTPPGVASGGRRWYTVLRSPRDDAQRAVRQEAGAGPGEQPATGGESTTERS